MVHLFSSSHRSRVVWTSADCVLCHQVNPNGGAIAFGHPLGCTGARQVSTLMNELGRTGKTVGVTSMCVGTGMGMAAVWVKE